MQRIISMECLETAAYWIDVPVVRKQKWNMVDVFFQFTYEPGQKKLDIHCLDFDVWNDYCYGSEKK